MLFSMPESVANKMELFFVTCDKELFPFIVVNCR